MPDFGTTFGIALLVTEGSFLSVFPRPLGETIGIANIQVASSVGSVGGGELSSAIGEAYMQALGATIEMDTFLGASSGLATMQTLLDLEALTVDTPLPRSGEEAVLCVGTGLGILRSEIKRLSLVDVALQVYALWGFQLQSLAQINIGLPAITAWTNAAMQLIYSNADRLEYFSKNTKTITVSTSGEVTLDSSIQRVLGSVRLATTKKTLRMLPSLEALEQFSLRFLDDTVATPSAPLAYYIDSSRADGPDSVALTLHVIPAPEASVDVLIEVCDEPPRYEPQDFYLGTPLQLPHKWAETILLPLVKQWALGDTIMPSSLRDGVKAQIGEQYDAARAMLGMATTDEPAKENAKPKGAASPS